MLGKIFLKKIYIRLIYIKIKKKEFYVQLEIIFCEREYEILDINT